MSPEAFLTGIISTDSIHTLLSLGLGFAFAGLLSSGYQVFTAQPPNFLIINRGKQTQALAVVPFLIFAAPFIIMHNTLRGGRIERSGFGVAMLATLVAGFWSLMSGTVVVMAIEAVV